MPAQLSNGPEYPRRAKNRFVLRPAGFRANRPAQDWKDRFHLQEFCRFLERRKKSRMGSPDLQPKTYWRDRCRAARYFFLPAFPALAWSSPNPDAPRRARKA